MSPNWAAEWPRDNGDLPDTDFQRGYMAACAEVEQLLSSWASFAKAMNLTERNAELADYDDELASEIVETARATLKWRDKRAARQP